MEIFCEKILAPSQKIEYINKAELVLDNSTHKLLDSIENHQILSVPLAELPKPLAEAGEQRNINHVTAIPIIVDMQMLGCIFPRQPASLRPGNYRGHEDSYQPDRLSNSARAGQKTDYPTPPIRNLR